MAHILVIDDDPQMRAMLEKTLQTAGHEVSVAENGNAGLQVQCTKPAELIITDLLMPEKDGLETIVELRQHFPKVPIITISGRPSTGFFLHMATHLGALRTVEKPFPPAEILAAVDEALKQNPPAD
jgi:DNA-binding response OmpR family regulator